MKLAMTLTMPGATARRGKLLALRQRALAKGEAAALLRGAQRRRDVSNASVVIPESVFAPTSRGGAPDATSARDSDNQNE